MALKWDHSNLDKLLMAASATAPATVFVRFKSNEVALKFRLALYRRRKAAGLGWDIEITVKDGVVRLHRPELIAWEPEVGDAVNA